MPEGNCLRGILVDDQGSVCRIMERKAVNESEDFNWDRLNDLPYGKYTLELRQGEDELRMNLVKRV